MNHVYPEISELVAGLAPVNQRTTPPEGNYPSGLELEEYRMGRRWLQIARDPAIGGEVVEYHWSEFEEQTWRVG